MWVVRDRWVVFFADMFRTSGYIVKILTEDTWDQVETLCKGTDLVLLSVPINVTLDTINRIVPHLPSTAVSGRHHQCQDCSGGCHAQAVCGSCHRGFIPCSDLPVPVWTSRSLPLHRDGNMKNADGLWSS